MEIGSLEDFVMRQVEAMDRIITNSQEATIPAEKIADFIPPIDLPEPPQE